MYTHKSATEKWLEGVTNVAFEFRPVIYKTNAIPRRSDILSALQALSRLTRFGGFINESIEGMYAQQVEYAIEHMSHRVWGDAQCSAAMDAITETLSTYLHYDPAIGNGVAYHSKCFYKTLKAVDKAYEENQGVMPVHGVQVEVWKKVVPCCLTPYYKHTVIKDPNAKPSFKYVPSKERQALPNNGYVKLPDPPEYNGDALIIDEKEQDRIEEIMRFWEEEDDE